jgi:nucleoside-diphosphate-sugar epimerase
MGSTARKALLLAGNGFIGRPVAETLATEGWQVTVHHTGRADIPNGSAIESVVAHRSAPPILSFPDSIQDADWDIAIHFLCMGAEDARAFVRSFDGRASRLVLISSCDVYRAYGRFIRTEPGPPGATALDESAPVRQRLYPYRSKATSAHQLEYWYDKLEAERLIGGTVKSDFAILRLPKVYGRAGDRLQTVYGFSHQPSWCWTHGHVQNVASAIALASSHPEASGQVFNLGEVSTPTMGERLARLPTRSESELVADDYDFRQHLHFDTNKIRSQLGYEDSVDEIDAMRDAARE